MARKHHPIAKIFPLMDDEDLDALADDIRDNGLKEPIWLYDGMVLDGRNRAAACLIAGVEPTAREFTGTRAEALNHVWSLNRTRRHLNSSQAAIAEAKRAKLCEEYAEELEKLRAEQRSRQPEDSCSQLIDSSSVNDRKTDAIRAKSAGTNRDYVTAADKIVEERPDLAERIEHGELTIPQARDAIRREEREQTLKTQSWPTGKYRVIYADPPWAYNDKRTGGRSSGCATSQYDTMPLDAICRLDVKALASKDSVLFLWATAPLIPDALQAMSSWGFKYKACFVWDKQRGYNGHYNDVRHELLMVGVHGSCTPDRRDLFPSIIAEPRGRHSAKPKKFREIINELYPHGPRVELFARTVADGWDTWGNEI